MKHPLPSFAMLFSALARTGALRSGTLAASCLTACGATDEAGTGALSVLLEAEDTIFAGIDPGEGDEDVRDGWAVRFDKYLLTVGEIELHSATNPNDEAHADELFVVDLVKLPAQGLPLWKIAELGAGRWEFGYATSGAAHEPERHKSVSRDDFDRMVEADATYLIQGTLTKEDGRSCPPPALTVPEDRAPEGENGAGHACYSATSIEFEFLVGAETVFGPCQIDGLPGVSIPTGGTQTVAVTIHGDHVFFNGFPSGDEGGTVRLAQWLADSDLDLNGQVTERELASIPKADLAELDERYQWSSAPLEVETMWDYVRAQLKTQGHMDGEGECAIDGEEPEHAH